MRYGEAKQCRGRIDLKNAGVANAEEYRGETEFQRGRVDWGLLLVRHYFDEVAFVRHGLRMSRNSCMAVYRFAGARRPEGPVRGVSWI